MDQADKITVTDRSRLFPLYVLIIAMAVPVMLWVTVAVFLGGMTLPDAVSARTFRIYFCILTLLSLVQAVVSLVRRSFAAALFSGGIFLLLAQGVLWYGFRFTGEAGAGTGDQIVDYHREQRGAWSGDTRIPARLEVIPEKGEAPVEFSIGEKRVRVPLEGSFKWNGYRLSPVAIEWAPLMTLETAAGQQVETLYIKMGTVPPERDFFLVKTLPHRIYIAPDGARGLKVRIVRDKIEIVAKNLPWAEKLRYDDHAIRFFRGAPWVRITVEKTVPVWPAIAGGGMLIAGLVISRMRKRTDQC